MNDVHPGCDPRPDGEGRVRNGQRETHSDGEVQFGGIAAGKQPALRLGVADAALQRDRQRHQWTAEELVIEGGSNGDIAAARTLRIEPGEYGGSAKWAEAGPATHRQSSPLPCIVVGEPNVTVDGDAP